jgi:anaerobic dimethyl sulfoxide reductase subunit C (anchor subunit)
MSGYHTALAEISLVFFTTVAPGAVLSYVFLALLLVVRLARRGSVKRPLVRIDADGCKGLSNWLIVPITLSMVGLIASATHLGNPTNALYVFDRIGRSPLSDEVAAAVLFLLLSGTYWLYSFARGRRLRLEAIWLALSAASGLLLILMISVAYDVPTIISWNQPLQPLTIWVNSLQVAPAILLLTLKLARQRLSPLLCRLAGAVSAAATLCGLALYLLLWTSQPIIANYSGSLFSLVPSFYPLLLGYLLLGLMGSALLILLSFRKPHSAWLRVLAPGLATILLYASIFCMRFVFYAAHMTAGVSF